MFNILTLFSWTTWFIITIFIIIVFWLFYGGRQEYEFVGVKPLSTKSIFENMELSYNPVNDVKINTFRELQKDKKIEKPQNCKGEELMAEILEKILSSKVRRNYRPSFLRNPETGKNLELDCYNEEYAIAVEYNGVQHYKFPSAFHKTEKEFMDQLYRDRLKKKLCDEAGVYLICVPYWVDIYGSEDNHLNNETKSKIFVSREVRYQRIYDYLYERIKEYFMRIFPEEYEDENSNKVKFSENLNIDNSEDEFIEDDEEDDYEEEEDEFIEEEEEDDYDDEDLMNVDEDEDLTNDDENEEDQEFISYKNSVYKTIL
jgi:hypothetical protein